jgi:hypothetical protein
MLVKLGKQVKMPTNKNFIIKYGTINALNPQSIYVSLHSWATPRHNLRFDKKLRSLTLNVKNKIHRSINYDVFHKKYIVDFDLRASGLQKNKSSFLSVEITLFPKQILNFPSDIYDNNIKGLIDDLTAQIKMDKNFVFTAKKINYGRIDTK